MYIYFFYFSERFLMYENGDIETAETLEENMTPNFL